MRDSGLRDGRTVPAPGIPQDHYCNRLTFSEYCVNRLKLSVGDQPTFCYAIFVRWPSSGSERTEQRKDARMWSIPANGSSNSSVGLEQAQLSNTTGSADLFVANHAGWAGAGGAAGGGATSNDSEPSPATTASPASQGRPATVNPGPRPAQQVASAPQSVPQASTSNTSAAASGKVKRRKWTREERAEHSTIEKKRREDFNVSLLVSGGLALPGDEDA